MIANILLVAAREFRQIAGMRSFWVTLLILPLALAAGPLASRLTRSDHIERVMLIDAQGGTAQAIRDRLETDRQRDLLTALSRYAERHDLDRADRDAVWARHDRLYDDADIAAFVRGGGVSGALAVMKPAITVQTPRFEPPEADFVIVPTPAAIADAPPARLNDLLTPLIQPSASGDGTTKPIDYILFVPRGFGLQTAAVRLWSSEQPAATFLQPLQAVLTRHLRRAYLQSNGLTPVQANVATTMAPSIAVSTPPPGGGRERVFVRSIVPLLSAYILLMSLLLSGSWILQGLVEERSNKLLETVLACISPNELLYGKLAGAVAVGVTMVLVWSACAAGAAFATQGVVAEFLRPALAPLASPGVVATMIYFFFAGYLMMAMILLAIGAMSDSMRDAQSYLTPVLLVIATPFSIVAQGHLVEQRGRGDFGDDLDPDLHAVHGTCASRRRNAYLADPRKRRRAGGLHRGRVRPARTRLPRQPPKRRTEAQSRRHRPADARQADLMTFSYTHPPEPKRKGSSMPTKIHSRLFMGVAALALSASVLVQASSLPATRYGTFGLDLTAADKAVKPGDDFWSYANGSWDKRTAIAADRTSAGGAVILADQAEAQVRAILDDAARDPAAVGAGAKQFGDLYASFMDEPAIEHAGTAPLQPYFAKIDAANDPHKLQILFSTVGYASPVEVGQLPDPADPKRYAVAAGQGALGMGGRDYYLEQGPKYDAYRKAYRAYVEQMLTLAGIADPSAKADRIVALETAMAKVQWSPVQSRDLKAMLKPMDAVGRAALAPQFDWPLLLGTAGYGGFPTVYMTQSTALSELGKIFAATPASTWQDWMKFNLIVASSPVLPHTFDQATFDFYGHTLADQPQQRARWKRGIAVVNGSMGEAVGAIYVKRHYPAASEAQMNELIANLRAAYKAKIEGSTWMDAATKQQALAKLAAFDPRVGHPLKYIDYSSLNVVRGDPVGNALRAGQFEHQLELSRLGKPVDRSLWGMTPQTVNAYYDPLNNQITFPAAILQPPYFDPNADAAVNYGAIGAIIGHEMGHAFDDQGSQFSASGKFENWWTPAARAAYTKHTAALSKQYDAYEPITGVRVKGALTLGENIGDLSGVENAYAAYQRYQAVHGKARVIDGLTGDQRFFLAYAQAWQSKLREGAARARLLTDPHSPPYYRVNGIVRNVDAWYAAFEVKPGDKMYLAPADRIHIW